MVKDKCQGCCNGLLPKELSVEEWHDEYLKFAIYAVSLANENTKLQNQIDYLMDSEHLETVATFAMGCDECGKYKMDLSDAITENVQLCTENDKLRELIAKYSAAAKYLCEFSHCNECNLDCASVFGDVPSGWDCARMLLDKKARELGVKMNYK